MLYIKFMFDFTRTFHLRLRRCVRLITNTYVDRLIVLHQQITSNESHRITSPVLTYIRVLGSWSRFEAWTGLHISGRNRVCTCSTGSGTWGDHIRWHMYEYACTLRRHIDVCTCIRTYIFVQSLAQTRRHTHTAHGPAHIQTNIFCDTFNFYRWFIIRNTLMLLIA